MTLSWRVPRVLGARRKVRKLRMVWASGVKRQQKGESGGKVVGLGHVGGLGMDEWLCGCPGLSDFVWSGCVRIGWHLCILARGVVSLRGAPAYF